jgi:glycosyltransferase involved in cell wall biosynthesis
MTIDETLVEVAEKSPQLLHEKLKARFEKSQIPSDEDLSLILLRLIKMNSPQTVNPILTGVINLVSPKKGLQSSINVLSRIEVALDFRKPSLGIYDNAFHFIGGAQKYGLTIAQAMQEEFDITLIVNTDISLAQLEKWYDLDLSLCSVKVLKLSDFADKEKKKGVFDAGEVDLKGNNPFHIVSKDSGNYDFFINNCMLEMVYPLSNISELVCHFPEREISRFFHIDRYTHIIFNSQYTAEWIKKRWRLDPHVHIYPPVDMVTPLKPDTKDNIILSVSRFELGGNKQQLEMTRAFIKLRSLYPEIMKTWKFVMVGGSTPTNPYLERIKSVLSLVPDNQIELKVNISAEELKKIYQKAKVFWHFCGYMQTDPARIEHFGMTTVEAMQSGCVPVVFNGGGQKEIIETQDSGFLFDDYEEMVAVTLDLLQNPSLISRISQNAYQRGKQFTKEIFKAKVKKHFSELLRTYKFL